MTFAGLSKPEERAAVIRYMAANTQNPPPLPEPKAPAAPAATPPAETSAAAAPAAVAPVAAAVVADLPTLLAAADPVAGEKAFGKCKSCHSADKGGANKVGPNLWDIVERAKGSHPAFSYSGVLAGAGGTWTYQDLDAYLANPKGFLAGNKMTFAGLSKPEERAAVIAWLRMQSDSPKPLP
jgi:cytochrome c